MKIYAALDVGGSSIKAAVVDGQGHFLSGIKRYPSHSHADAETILDNLSRVISLTASGASHLGAAPSGIGIGFPGPFDYQNGISLIKGLNKYDSIYQIPLREELRSRLPFHTDIRFANDADLYCMGECTFGVGKAFQRVMCICIGTGIGSGFFADGVLLKSDPDIPENGWIYSTPYRDSIADHYASASGLRAMIRSHPTLRQIPDVKELDEAARAGDLQAQDLFRQFGGILADIVVPYAKRFRADCVVVGGDVAKGFDLFSDPLAAALRQIHIQTLPSVRFSDNTLLAAPLLFHGAGTQGAAQ